MINKTNLRHADRPALESEDIYREASIKPISFPVPIRAVHKILGDVHEISGDVHDLLSEKERHACNRATD